jgi:hypothetical protein
VPAAQLRQPFEAASPVVGRAVPAAQLVQLGEIAADA